MSANQSPYEGCWTLIPELSIYEEGDVPRWGVYEIKRDGLVVSFHVTWEASDGKRSEISFSGALDGRKQSISNPPGAHVEYHQVDPSTLDSSVFAGNARIAYARRRVSSDGRLLAVAQETRRKDGSTFRNFQVYRSTE